MRNKNFREELEDAHPSLDGSVKKQSQQPSPGEDVVQELDVFNLRYQRLSETLRARLTKIGEGEEARNDPDIKVSCCFIFFLFCVISARDFVKRTISCQYISE